MTPDPPPRSDAARQLGALAMRFRRTRRPDPLRSADEGGGLPIPRGRIGLGRPWQVSRTFGEGR